MKMVTTPLNDIAKVKSGAPQPLYDPRSDLLKAIRDGKGFDFLLL